MAGIAGAGGTVVNSSVSGSASGGIWVGGVVGIGGPIVENVTADVDVSGSNSIGGVLGFGNGTARIRQVHVSGNVSAAHSGRSGGIIGNINQTFTIGDSYVTGNVNSGNETGGLVGFISGASAVPSEITNSYFNGSSLTGGPSAFGAIVGHTNGAFRPLNITNVFSTASRSLVVGRDTATVVNTYTNLPEVTFYAPTHPVYTGVPSWDFTDIWNSPGGVAVPTHQ